MTIALVGNQNSGKTALFNQLTGANQRVGNFPGVTVEKKQGVVRQDRSLAVVDLPGIYSLTPYTGEERVTRDFLIRQKPDGIINIIDVTNVERNLYLTLQLLELGIPVVVALNMMDELQNNGGSLRLAEFIEELGVPVVPICAIKNEGVDELVRQAAATVGGRTLPRKIDFCEGAVHRCIHGISHLIEDHAERIGLPRRFAATKLIEQDAMIVAALRLDANETEMVEHGITEMEKELGTDRQAALADMRYAFIEKLVKETVVKPRHSKEFVRSGKIDHVLTHKHFGIPLFLGIMMLVFWLTFGVIGKLLTWVLENGIGRVTEATSALLTHGRVNSVVHDLIIDGVFAGVGSVLSFLPIIVTLFFFLSFLEDSGYMARVAFVMDRPLRKLGLSGRSFVPMLLGFGCSVPAIMATRTLANERDRKLTILLIPFMSCSAKLPIYAMLCAAFFPKSAAFVMMGLYLLGMAAGILVALLFKTTLFRGQSVPFVLEMPNYRLPSARSMGILSWHKTKDFIQKAFTLIFIASLLIWFLRTFDFRINVVDDAAQSMLAQLGKYIATLFTPLGIGDWRAVTALISGFTAKEAVVSTLAVLTGANADTLKDTLQTLFTPASAAAYLVFTLLYTPCIAAVAAVRREMGVLSATLIVLFQLAIAWLAAFACHALALLLL
ncbi:MAG: ferrous iron transport protein B [Kiritimatiellaeota bacterium]|nr:ferrous iron transport protein B [Kiritimatiellota bacterium]